MANEQNLKPFKKGDARINRKGRPKNFDGLRALARDIADEELVSGDGAVKMTAVEAILRKWASSGNPQLQKQFIEVAYGKVPDQVEVTGKDGGAIQVSDARNKLDNLIARHAPKQDAGEDTQRPN